MNNRIIMVMFDLPNKEKEERVAYRKFYKYLKSNGYNFVQESVYVKLLRNFVVIESEISKLYEVAPTKGTVMALPMNLNQFKKIRTVCGKGFDVNFFSDNVISI